MEEDGAVSHGRRASGCQPKFHWSRFLLEAEMNDINMLALNATVPEFSESSRAWGGSVVGEEGGKN